MFLDDGTAPMRSNEPMRLGSRDIVGLRRGVNPLDIIAAPSARPRSLLGRDVWLEDKI